MTPQSSFMVLAPMTDGGSGELRELLASHEPRAPGVADPENALVPFGQFERLHFARFVILEAPTAGRHRGLWPAARRRGRRRSRSSAIATARPIAFLARARRRGPAPACARSSRTAGTSRPRRDLLDWMKRHEQPLGASYVNWIGRTVRQIREEQALHARAGRAPAERRGRWHRRRAAGRAARPAGRLRATPSGRPAACTLTPRSADAARLAPAQRDRTRSACRWPCSLLAPFLLVASPVLRLPAALAREGRSRDRAPPRARLRPARWPSSRTTTSPISSPCSATSSPAGSGSGPRCSCSGCSTTRRATSSTAAI